jgi:hypothetical protein
MKNTILFTLILFLILTSSCLESTKIEELPDLNFRDQELDDQINYILDDQGNLLEFHDFEFSEIPDQG